jgi:hypothetical protein
VPAACRAAWPAPGQLPEWPAVLAGGSPWAVDHADALDSLDALPDASVHCCLTSPPFGRLQDYGVPPSRWPDGWEGCLGLEPTSPSGWWRRTSKTGAGASASGCGSTSATPP